MGAVDHLRATAQLPVWEDLQAIIMDAKHQVQQVMDPGVFSQAWEEGAVISLDKMVTFAMEG